MLQATDSDDVGSALKKFIRRQKLKRRLIERAREAESLIWENTMAGPGSRYNQRHADLRDLLLEAAATLDG